MNGSSDWWAYLVAAANVVIAIGVSIHIVLRKEEDRAAVAWLAMILLSPFVGVVLYWLFGVNRIKRRALKLRGFHPDQDSTEPVAPTHPDGWPADDRFYASQARLVRRSPQALDFSAGNAVQLLRSGDVAYPQMLDAIRAARASVALASYIFNNDTIGRRFAQELGQAAARGVEVRVLIDGIGALYSLPTAIGLLRSQGIRTARFLTSILPWRMPYLNLRNHRKILVVDGTIGFTGGMNIKHGHMLSEQPSLPTLDTQFRIEGPAVGDLMATFADDWSFTTGETLTGSAWFAAPASDGSTVMRCIASGPNERVGSLRLTLLGALAQVERSLRIATPYFLPDEEITSLLVIASLRGVAVDVVLPNQSNLFFMKWAETASFRRLIAAGCRVWLEAPPFDHTKVAVADGRWVLFGSSNWDSRSLRLNFELDCEAFDPTLAQEIERLIDEKIARSEPVTRERLAARPFIRRLIDGVVRLFKPFL